MQQKRNDSGVLNFYLLKCLVALVDHSHVSRAGEALTISQPAMSRAMAQLREVTADPILVKGGSGLIPTAKAIQLREFAERILKEMDQLLGNAVAFDPGTTRYAFRIVATDYLECVFMDRLVQRLSTDFPGISVTVRQPLHPSQITKVLEAGEADFCIGILPSTLGDLRHRLLFRDHVVCVARQGHPASGRKLSAVEFAALEHIVIMPTSYSFGEALDQALDAHGLRRNRRYVTPHYLTVPELVEKSDMVSLLPWSLAVRVRERFRLCELEIPLAVPLYEVYLYWHDRTHHHAAHMWFRDQAVQTQAYLAQVPPRHAD